MGGKRTGTSSVVKIWPWSARVAVLLIPAILVVLVIAHAVARTQLDWPDERYGGWVLLGIALLSLLPVLLMLIELLALAGGSLKVAGVAFSFSGESLKVAGAVRSTTLAENLETPDNAPVAQTSLNSVLRALRRAHDSEVTIVDLRHGRTWWETRLFILIAGAARTGRPKAIGFIGDRNGKQGVFLGWASPRASSTCIWLRHRSSPTPTASPMRRQRNGESESPRHGRAGVAPRVTVPWNQQQLFLPRSNTTFLTPRSPTNSSCSRRSIVAARNCGAT
jgi:hypothetical protein